MTRTSLASRLRASTDTTSPGRSVAVGSAGIRTQYRQPRCGKGFTSRCSPDGEQLLPPTLRLPDGPLPTGRHSRRQSHPRFASGGSRQASASGHARRFRFAKRRLPGGPPASPPTRRWLLIFSFSPPQSPYRTIYTTINPTSIRRGHLNDVPRCHGQNDVLETLNRTYGPLEARGTR